MADQNLVPFGEQHDGQYTEMQNECALERKFAESRCPVRIIVFRAMKCTSEDCEAECAQAIDLLSKRVAQAVYGELSMSWPHRQRSSLVAKCGSIPSREGITGARIELFRLVDYLAGGKIDIEGIGDYRKRAAASTARSSGRTLTREDFTNRLHG